MRTTAEAAAEAAALAAEEAEVLRWPRWRTRWRLAARGRLEAAHERKAKAVHAAENAVPRQLQGSRPGLERRVSNSGTVRHFKSLTL